MAGLEVPVDYATVSLFRRGLEKEKEKQKKKEEEEEKKKQEEEEDEKNVHTYTNADAHGMHVKWGYPGGERMWWAGLSQQEQHARRDLEARNEQHRVLRDLEAKDLAAFVDAADTDANTDAADPIPTADNVYLLS